MHANKDANASLSLQQNNWYSNLHPPNTIYLSRCNEIFNMLLLYVRTCFIHNNLLSVSLNQHCTLQLDSFLCNYLNICLDNPPNIKWDALDINHDRIRAWTLLAWYFVSFHFLETPGTYEKWIFKMKNLFILLSRWHNTYKCLIYILIQEE